MASVSNRRYRLAAAGIAATTALAGLAMAGPANSASTPSFTLKSGAVKGVGTFKKPATMSQAQAERAAQHALPSSGRYAFLVKLNPLGTAAVFDRTKSADGLSAAKREAASHLAVVRAAQDNLVSHLSSLPGTSQVLYRTHAIMAGVAVVTDVKNFTRLGDLPGVAAVYPISPKAPDNSYAVPFQGAPAAWDGDQYGKYLGQGVVVADIDTGLDYTHADFGGPGTPAAYEAAHAADTVAPAAGTYDPQKFLAGLSYDLAGDSYNADPTAANYQPKPHPDPNPLDCSPQYGGDGHGSHTAGTIAGYGVVKNGDGTQSTYTGPYTSAAVNTADTSQFEIGPGMAPKATLVSYRVFGCSGSTDLVAEAIDRAMDPNGDGDTSDHVDVINMSLGSDFGAPDDGDAIAANAAADLGVTLSISMGNSYDVYDIGGTPGAASKAITVAASVDAQETDDTVNLNISGGSDPSIDGNASVAGTRSIMYAWGQPGEQYGGGDMPSSAQLIDLASVDPNDATACNPISDPNGQLNGKIVVVPQWNDSAPECGSIARGANIRNAGGVGFLFLSNRNSVSAGINGDEGADGKPDDGTTSTDAIPGALVVQGTNSGAPTDSQLISQALADGATITIPSTSASTSTHDDTSLNNTMTDFSSRGLRGNGDLKPDVAAVGATVFSVLPGAGTSGQSMSGTSMAAPMVAGLAALVKSKHPNWAPAQVKADIMNTADQKLTVGPNGTGATYAPMRVGAGRIDAATAINNQVLAAVKQDPGEVSASFGSFEFTGAVTKTKTITLQNTGVTDETYTAAVNDATSVPGVTYSVSPSTVTVPARGTANVTLTLKVNPAQFSKTFDTSKGTYDAADNLSLDPATGAPQETIAEASGDVIFTPADNVPSLRVPYYAAPKPASQMAGPSNIALSKTGLGSFNLTGKPVVTADASPATGLPSVLSLAEPFELTATSGADKPCTAAQMASASGPSMCLTNAEDKGSDIKYVGVARNSGTFLDQTNDNASVDSQGNPVANPTLDFAIVTQGVHTTPADKNTFVIYFDTNGDGKPDFYTVNTHYDSSDFVVSSTFSTTKKDSTGADLNVDVEILNNFMGELDTSAYDSDVAVIPVATSVFGNAKTIHYGIEAIGSQGSVVDRVGYNGSKVTLVAHPQTPGLSTANVLGDTQVVDAPTSALAGTPLAGLPTSLKVTRKAASYKAEGGKGLLLVHFHNAVGKKAQLISLKNTTTPSVAPSGTVTHGKRSTIVVTVPTTGQYAPTGRVTLMQGSKRLGTAVVSGGRATFHVIFKSKGKVTLTASYAGDGNYAAARSKARTITVR